MRNLQISFISILVFFAGIVNIISSLWANSLTRISWLADVIPLNLSNLSRTLTVISGLVLILLARGLSERKSRAWYLSLFFLSLSFLTHLIKGLDFEEIIADLCVTFLLIRYRALFTVRSGKFKLVSIVKNTLMIIIIFFAYVIIGHLGLRENFSGSMTVRNISFQLIYLTTGYGKPTLIPQTPHASWFHDSILVFEVLLLLVIITTLLSPFIEERESLDAEQAVSLVKRLGRNSLSPLSLMSDKKYFIVPEHPGLIAYAISGKFAVVLGDPIAYEEDLPDFLIKFYRYTESCGLSVVWYNCTPELLSHLSRFRVKSLCIGEEAIIDLKQFTLVGSQMKDVRNAVTKLDKYGVSYQFHSFPDTPWHILADVDRLKNNWLSAKHIPPMGFSMDFYPFPVTNIGYLLTAYKKDKLEAALSFLTYQRGKSYSLDLMLRSEAAENGIMEASIAQASFYLRERGAEILNLSLAPLSHHTSKTLDLLNKWYKFRPLKAFKNKFNPYWVPKYLVVNKKTELPGVLFALGRLHFRKV